MLCDSTDVVFSADPAGEETVECSVFAACVPRASADLTELAECVAVPAALDVVEDDSDTDV